MFRARCFISGLVWWSCEGSLIEGKTFSENENERLQMCAYLGRGVLSGEWNIFRNPSNCAFSQSLELRLMLCSIEPSGSEAETRDACYQFYGNQIGWLISGSKSIKRRTGEGGKTARKCFMRHDNETPSLPFYHVAHKALISANIKQWNSSISLESTDPVQWFTRKTTKPSPIQLTAFDYNSSLFAQIIGSIFVAMTVSALFVRSCDLEMDANAFIYMLFLIYFRGTHSTIVNQFSLKLNHFQSTNAREESTGRTSVSRVTLIQRFPSKLL